MTSPAPGAVLPGSSVTFTWSAGSGPTAYTLYLGTSLGASDVYNSGSIAGTSINVTGLPTNGVNLYATLYSMINGAWVPQSYTFTEAGTVSAAALTSPVAGSTLFGPSATFTWTAGTGPTGYTLYVGTAQGTSNIFNSGTLTGTSATVTGLPTTGVPLYVTLFSRINGSWKPAFYTFTEASPAAPAAVTAPASATVFTGSSVAFSWSAGSQVTAYSLTLGTTGAGSSDLYSSGSISGTSVAVTGLPTLGATVYATLSSQIGGAWQSASYTYTEAAPTLAAMTSPAAGSVLSGSSATFTWSAGSGPTAYTLYLGTSAGASNVYNSGSVTGTSVSVTGLPTNGVNLYATLYSKISGSWKPVSYTFVEAGTAAAAVLTSPVAGSTLLGPSVTFQWTAGSGPTAYFLYVGTAAGSSNLFSSGSITATSAAVTGLPTTGAPIYVTLFSQMNGAWKPVAYTFTQASPAAPAAIAAPASASVFTGSSVTFSWSAGSQVSAYSLTLGTTGAGASNLYSSGSISARSVTVTGLPTLGATVYATLSSEIGGVWQSASYTYTEAAPTLAALTSPAAGSVLSGSSVTFTWSAGSGPSAYTLYLGTSAGTANIYNSGSITGTSVSVTGLPVKGVYLYATLYSKINGSWKPVSYTFTEAGTAAPAALTSPVAGTVLPGSSVSFQWTAGNGPTAYVLYVGTASGSSNVFSSGAITATSATVTGLPTTGAPLYVTLFSQMNGAWKPVAYAFTEAGGSSEATISSLTCASSSMIGSGTDSCTITLNKAAGSAGVDVILSSSNGAAKVPAIATVPANSTSVGFSATVSAVTSAVTVTLTANSDSVSKTYSLQLNPPIPTLTVSSSSLAFGNVVLNAPSTQSLTLTSTGTGPVTISSAKLSGNSGFSISGVAFPLTLNPNQTAVLELEFNPTVTGLLGSLLTLTSNSSSGATATVNLTGTGLMSTFQVDLSWDAVSGGSVPVAGYYVFRAPAGGSYTMLTTSVDAQNSFTDLTVASGVTYDYYIESVGTNGLPSAPSDVFSVSIP